MCLALLFYYFIESEWKNGANRSNDGVPWVTDTETPCARAFVFAYQSTDAKNDPPRILGGSKMLALPIFTASRPATIVGGHELNFCVRDGNRWTLMPINTNSLFTSFSRSAASRSLLGGDPYGIRTHVNGVRGRCLNHLTNGPSIASASLLSPGPPSGTRTRDPLIKSQLLYQLS